MSKLCKRKYLKLYERKRSKTVSILWSSEYIFIKVCKELGLSYVSTGSSYLGFYRSKGISKKDFKELYRVLEYLYKKSDFGKYVTHTRQNRTAEDLVSNFKYLYEDEVPILIWQREDIPPYNPLTLLKKNAYRKLVK